MASLASYYINDKNNCISRPDTVIKGEKYRFTIITERVIRLEYSPNGVFEDRPTQRIICRNISEEKPPFVASETDILLQIQTKYFILDYVKNKNFDSGALAPGSNLKVLLKDTNHEWYYGHPEAKNFGGTNFALDNWSGEARLNPGLYSVDGFAVVDDSFSYVLNDQDEYVPRDNKGIDLYLFMYKRDFGDCLKDYYALTGYPSMIPRYAFGNWWYKDEAYNNKSLQELLDNFHEHGISLSALLLGSKWHNNIDNFDFDTSVWNIQNLRMMMMQNNIKLGVTINPLASITNESSQYQQLMNYTNGDKNYTFLPLTNQKLGFYVNFVVQKLMNTGVDFLYTDYSNIKDRENLWLFNHFNYTSMEALIGKRGLVVSRNPMIASHRYPILFSGKTKVNWETLNMLPYYNLSASNIGISYWAHAIGGFEGGIEDGELYLRYIQFGTFSPILMLASNGGKYYKREPWKWSDNKLKVMTDYLQLRVKLVPYLYSEGYIYHKYGLPMIKPLYYTYPKIVDEPRYRNEYFFGSEMLVAPITMKKNYTMNRAVMKVFIPDGIWYDFLTGKKYPGPNHYLSFYRDAEYPVFCKAGAIIPLSLSKDTNNPSNLEIQVFPGAGGIYDMYEDDGISLRYKAGDYLLTHIEYQYNGSAANLIIKKTEGTGEIGLTTRNYRIRFRNMTIPSMLGVYINRTLVKYNCYSHEKDFIIDIQNVNINSELIISYSGASEVEATRAINEEIEGILEDAEIPTILKEKMDNILFSDMPIKKKRIEIRKLRKDGLEPRFEKMFLNLLEYIKEV